MDQIGQLGLKTIFHRISEFHRISVFALVFMEICPVFRVVRD